MTTTAKAVACNMRLANTESGASFWFLRSNLGQNFID